MATTDISGAASRVDRAQRERTWAAVPVATVRKFQEDQSTNLAALIAFWGFFSIFPTFLVFSTLLGWFLPEDTREDVLSDVASYFPLLNVPTGGFSGSWWALAVGLVSALWAATGVLRTAQFAFNSVWEVPFAERPGIVTKTLNGLKVLGTVGVGVVLTAVLSGVVTGESAGFSLGAGARVGGFALTLLLDIAIAVVAFRLLTSRDISLRDVLPGAILTGVVFFVLQSLSTLIISRYLSSAEDTYGNFATVITILWWFYLTSIVALLGAQLNVVLKERLWPRSLTGDEETDADRRAHAMLAKERRQTETQQVDVEFEDSEGDARRD